jgi:hypothetical protein
MAGSSALCREVDWQTELAFDAVLGAGAYGIERSGPYAPRMEDDDFPTQPLDDNVAHAIRGSENKVATTKEQQYRDFSNVSVVVAAALPTTIALTTNQTEAAGVFMTTAHTLVLSNFLVTAVKYSVRRPRPEAHLMLPEHRKGDNALSFPSGHSATAFAAATLVPRLFPAAPIWIKGGGFALAGMTAWARVAGDKHYFSDVLVGGLIGAGSALVVDSWINGPEQSYSLLIGSDFVGAEFRF